MNIVIFISAKPYGVFYLWKNRAQRISFLTWNISNSSLQLNTFYGKWHDTVKRIIVKKTLISLYISDSYSKGKARIKKLEVKTLPFSRSNRGHQSCNGRKSHLSKLGVLKSVLLHLV